MQPTKLEMIKAKMEKAMENHQAWLDWYHFVFIPAMEKEPKG